MVAYTITRKQTVLLVVTALSASIVAAVAFPAAAAGQTEIRLDPGSSELDVDETTSLEVVATNADGGVGAYNATVSIDATHAKITNASVENATFKRIVVADDGSSAHLAVALLDTPDDGTVSIGTLTIQGVTPGTDTLTPRMDEMADEEGHMYEVADTSEATITVTEQSGDDDADGAPDGVPGDSGSAGVFDRLAGELPAPVVIVIGLALTLGLAVVGIRLR